MNLKKFLDLGDPGRSSDQDDFVDVRLVELGVSQRPLDWVHRAAEQVGVQLLETSSSDRRVEVDALKMKMFRYSVLLLFLVRLNMKVLERV